MSYAQQLNDWIAGSAFVENGEPIVWYHGTDSEDEFNIFTRWEDGTSFGFHFGTKQVAEARIANIYRMAPKEERGGRMIPVLCRARNPLVLPDLHAWGQRDTALALLDAGVLRDEDEVDHLVDTCAAEAIFAAIEEAGFDCIRYANLCENNGNAEHSPSLIVWRSELLKNPAAGAFDPDDPRLMPQESYPADEQDLAQWEALGKRIDSARRELVSVRERTPLAVP